MHRKILPRITETTYQKAEETRETLIKRLLEVSDQDNKRPNSMSAMTMIMMMMMMMDLNEQTFLGRNLFPKLVTHTKRKDMRYTRHVFKVRSGQPSKITHKR